MFGRFHSVSSSVHSVSSVVEYARLADSDLLEATSFSIQNSTFSIQRSYEKEKAMRITWLFLSVFLATVPAFADGLLNNESDVVAQVKGQGVAEGGTNATSGRLSYSAFYHGLFLTSRSLRQNEMSLEMERLRVMQDECYRLSVLAGYSLLDESVQTNLAASVLHSLVDRQNKLEQELRSGLRELEKLYREEYRLHVKIASEAGVLGEEEVKQSEKRLKSLILVAPKEVMQRRELGRTVEEEDKRRRTEDGLRLQQARKEEVGVN